MSRINTGRQPYQKGQASKPKSPKGMRKVSKKPDAPLRKSAKGETCTLLIPGVCNGDSETTVLCHVSTAGGSGMATKPIDMHGLYGCSACHSVLDRRDQWAKHELSWFHVLLAVFETQRRMIEKGLIFCK